MEINIRNHYFAYYADSSELNELGGFRIGEIITDWFGFTGCILSIYKDGSVRTDSSGMGELSCLKKVRSRKKVEAYLLSLHKADMGFMARKHKEELASIR